MRTLPLVSVLVLLAAACGQPPVSVLPDGGEPLEGETDGGVTNADAGLPPQVPDAGDGPDGGPPPQPILKAIDVSAAGTHSCAVSEKNDAWCWGRGQWGQLGAGAQSSSRPVPLSSLKGNVASILSGYDFSCAFLTTGQLQCWGNNNQGKLGIGSAASSSAEPVEVQGVPGAIVSADLGENHACAVSATGVVYCWGSNGANELGFTGADQSKPTLPVALPNKAIAVGAGRAYSCALLDNGKVYCWGRNQFGNLGTGVADNSKVPQPVAGLPAKATMLSVGYLHACAVLETQQVFCWGPDGSEGSTPGGVLVPKPTATEITGLSGTITQLAVGEDVSCVQHAGGEVRCWGRNRDGLAGTQTTASHFDARKVPLSEPSTKLSSFFNHVCALGASGQVWCWGDNKEGQLGNGVSAWMSEPRAVSLPFTPQRVWAALKYTCAEGNQKIWCWGSNTYGNLGNGTDKSTVVPTEVVGLTGGMKDISLGERRGCAVTAAGAAACWGENVLTPGQPTVAMVPTTVTGLSSGVEKICTGFNHSCAVLSTGAVRCWGANSSGGLGNGTWVDSWAPVQVKNLPQPIVDVGCGNGFSCGLDQSGAVYCWGAGYNGQLGHGVKEPRNLPVAVALPSVPVSLLEVGGRRACATLKTGGVLCWGENAYGELGNGTKTESALPVAVQGVYDAEKLVLEQNYSAGMGCAIASTGTVTCWGLELGTTPVVVPKALTSLTQPVSQLAIATSHACALSSSGSLSCWGSNAHGQFAEKTDLFAAPVWARLE